MHLSSKLVLASLFFYSISLTKVVTKNVGENIQKSGEKKKEDLKNNNKEWKLIEDFCSCTRQIKQISYTLTHGTFGEGINIIYTGPHNLIQHS